jgi:hypothetical protein
MGESIPILTLLPSSPLLHPTHAVRQHINSLMHPAYTTSLSPRIREIMTINGGPERLVHILHEFCQPLCKQRGCHSSPNGATPHIHTLIRPQRHPQNPYPLESPPSFSSPAPFTPARAHSLCHLRHQSSSSFSISSSFPRQSKRRKKKSVKETTGPLPSSPPSPSTISRTRHGTSAPSPGVKSKSLSPTPIQSSSNGERVAS